MKKETFDVINKNTENLRRSNSKKWIMDAISLNPNVIIVTDEQGKADLISNYSAMIAEMENKPEIEPEFVCIEEDLTGLNKREKPIIFDSYLIIH